MEEATVATPEGITPENLSDICRRAAEAGAAAVRAHPQPERYTGTRNTGGDRVLAVDQAADRAIRESLAAGCAGRGTGYTVFSEESDRSEHGAAYPLFVIDPVDGSAQARRRHPDCAASVAVALGPSMVDLVAGAVAPINSGDSYWAIRGGGAWLGARRLPLIPVPDTSPSSAMLEGTAAAVSAALIGPLLRSFPGCQVQMTGSIALQLCLLAAGCYDLLAAARRGACAYDIAAAWLICTEAGVAYGDLGGLETASASLTDLSVRHQPLAARRADWLESLRVALLP